MKKTVPNTMYKKVSQCRHTHHLAGAHLNSLRGGPQRPQGGTAGVGRERRRGLALGDRRARLGLLGRRCWGREGRRLLRRRAEVQAAELDVQRGDVVRHLDRPVRDLRHGQTSAGTGTDWTAATTALRARRLVAPSHARCVM